jgi:CheY-like chemotaxis protein
MNVLLVDDDELFLKVASRKLKGMGHEVTEATDAQSALIEIRKHKPDLILSDLMMPHMSGLQLLNVVKYEYFEKIPFVLLTSLEENQVMNTSFELGADDYIVKPVDFSALEVKIKRWTKSFTASA